MKNPLYISVLALVVSIVALCASFHCCGYKKPTTGTNVANPVQVKAILEHDPEIIINALQKYEEAQRQAQLKEASRLFKENIEALNNDASSPFVGPKDAKVVLVEFFDFSCGYCKRLAPSVEAIVKKNPDVKVVFKPITFVAQISKYAAQAALAANNQGKFIEMYTALLGSPERLNEESINKFAEKIGLNMKKFNEDVKSEAVAQTIKDVASLADKLQIRGVPSLILNGTQIQVIDEAGIQAEINKVK